MIRRLQRRLRLQHQLLRSIGSLIIPSDELRPPPGFAFVTVNGVPVTSGGERVYAKAA